MKNKKTIIDIDIGRYHLKFKKQYEITYDFIIGEENRIEIMDPIFGYIESKKSTEDAITLFKCRVIKEWIQHVEHDDNKIMKQELLNLLEPIQILKEEYSLTEFVELLGLDDDEKKLSIDVLNQLNDSFKQFGYHIVLKSGVGD